MNNRMWPTSRRGQMLPLLMMALAGEVGLPVPPGVANDIQDANEADGEFRRRRRILAAKRAEELRNSEALAAEFRAERRERKHRAWEARQPKT